MRQMTWLGILCAGAVAALGACGDGSGSGGSQATSDSGAGASTMASTTGSGGAGGASTTSSTSATGTGGNAGTGGAAPTLVNGCDEATATDETAMSAFTITFGGATGLKYAPACVKVKAGTAVTFSGDFTLHPLQGGVTGTPDAASPITATSTGMTAAFTLPNAGTFPYYCTAHGPLSHMEGAIFVVP